jgi:hypothetical protein
MTTHTSPPPRSFNPPHGIKARGGGVEQSVRTFSGLHHPSKITFLGKGHSKNKNKFTRRLAPHSKYNTCHRHKHRGIIYKLSNTCNFRKTYTHRLILLNTDKLRHEQEHNSHTDKYTNPERVTHTNGISQYWHRLHLTIHTRPRFKHMHSTNTNRLTNIERYRYEHKTNTCNRQTHGHEHKTHMDKHTPNPHVMHKPIPNDPPP